MNPPGIGSKWRHKKRGQTYEVLHHNADFQCSSERAVEKMFEDLPFVVYQNVKTGFVAVRLVEEFMDGRFEPVEDAA